MRGVLVVGASLAADERAAGAAAAATLRRAGEEVAELAAVALGPGAGEPGAVHAHRALASPVTAAAHEGTSIDPAALLGALREHGDGHTLVATAPGGLLAALTARFAVRDLAVELGLPLLLAVPAGPDALNLARLSAESARGAGLRVAAVVLTGWPDPPDRVLIDERRLLESVSSVPVLALPAAAGAREDAVRRWDAAAWLDAGAGAGAGAAAAGPPPVVAARVVLDPYEAWTARPLGDPRGTSRPQIMAALTEIVAAEGPMRASRAYAIYNRAAGGKKLTTIARAPLSSAAYWLAREGGLVLTKRDEIPWQDDDLLRLPDAPAVHVRELGPRTLEEVPLDEIAELMRRLGGTADAARLKRRVLEAYGLVRLTARADDYLGLAHGLLTG